MTRTPDLMTWLRQQWDDDERAARAWLPLGNPTAADREHAARLDPGRVLADVDAKRRVLDLHGLIWRTVGWLETDDGPPYDMYEELEVCRHCVPRHSSFSSRAEVPTGPCLTVRLLSLSCVGRPGYRDEWRPEEAGDMPSVTPT